MTTQYARTEEMNLVHTMDGMYFGLKNNRFA